MTTVIAHGLPSVPVPPPPVGIFRIGTANGGDNSASILTVAHDATATLLDTVAAGAFPDGIAASPDGSLLAVANSGDGTVSIISTRSDVVLATIPVGSYPMTPAWSPNGSLVAVTNYTDASISIIEISTLTVIETITVGVNPVGVCFSPDGAYLAVAEQSPATVSTIETTGWTITNTGSVGTNPGPLDIALDGSYIAVADADGYVYIVDPTALTVSQTIPVGLTPVSVAIDPLLAFVVCVNTSDGTVSVIETTGWTVPYTITVGSAPYVLSIAPDSTFVAVPNAGDDTISIIRTSDWTVASTTAVTNPQAVVVFPIPPPPADIGEYLVATANAADNTGTVLDVTSDGVAHVDDTITGSPGSDVAVAPDGSLLAVTLPGDNTVALIETTLNSVVAVIDVGAAPVGVAFSNDGSLLAVANSGDDTVSIIDVLTRAVTQTVGTNNGPFGVCFAPDDSYLAVSHTVGQMVLTFETSGWTLLAGTTPLGSALFGIDVAPDGSYIAVVAQDFNVVYTLDPTSPTLDIVQTVTVGTSPVGLKIDPGGTFIVVSHSGEDNVYIVNTADWTVLTAVAVGPSPALLDVAPDSTFVAVPNSGDDTLTIIRRSDWSVASTTPGVATNPYAAAVYTRAATPDEPVPQALKNTWRWVVQGLDGVTKSFLDKLATNVQVAYVLDDAAMMTCDLPSDHFEVYQHANDGHPRVDYGIRVLYGLRREERRGKPPWTCRFAGLISIMQDQATEDEPISHLTAYDPWMWARTLPVLDIDGHLLGADGLTYEGKTADYIARDLIANAYAWIVATFPNPMPWSEQGDGVWLHNDGQHNFIDIDTGHFSRADVIPSINFAQGISVGEAWTQLCATGTIDIVLTPVYGRPGILCVMNVYKQAGKKRPNAVFGWDMFPRNLVGVDNLLDGTLIENYAQYWVDNVAAAAQQSTSSINKYGPYYVQRSYPAPATTSAAELLALAEVALRKQGKKTLVIDPSPGLAPDPFTQYGLGDQVPVWAGRPMPPPPPLTGRSVGNALRSGIRSRTLGADRVYGFLLDLSDDLQETVTGLLLTDPNETIE